MQDVVGVNCLRDENRSIVVKPEMARKRQEYMEHLLYTDNALDGMVGGRVETTRESTTEMERTTGQMKSGKVVGPTQLVGKNN